MQPSYFLSKLTKNSFAYQTFPLNATHHDFSSPSLQLSISDTRYPTFTLPKRPASRKSYHSLPYSSSLL